MESFGSPTGIGQPQFTAGRRRKFDEFASGEEVEVDRIHWPPYAQIPSSLGPTWSRFAARYEQPLHLKPHPQVDFPTKIRQRPLTLSQILAQTIAIRTFIIAVRSINISRIIFCEPYGPYATRERIQYTCTAVVQSSCNAAKRRRATICGHLPAYTSYQRHLFHSPSLFPSSPQSQSPGHSPREITTTGIPSEWSPCVLPDHAPEGPADKSDSNESDESYTTAPEIQGYESGGSSSTGDDSKTFHFEDGTPREETTPRGREIPPRRSARVADRMRKETSRGMQTHDPIPLDSSRRDERSPGVGRGATAPRGLEMSLRRSVRLAERRAARRLLTETRASEAQAAVRSSRRGGVQRERGRGDDL